MLLWLTEYLAQYVSGFSVFQYLTFRTMVSVITALFMSLLIGPYVIRRLAELQIGQTVRDDGPQSHLSKAGTPTTTACSICFMSSPLSMGLRRPSTGLRVALRGARNR